MTSSEPSPGTAARRPRRAVRHAGTVGGDDANLVSSHPAFPADPHAPGLGDDPAHRDTSNDARRNPSAGPGRAGERQPSAAPGDAAHEPPVALRSVDDSDVGWGDPEAGSNDDRLHQDKPPHW